MKEQPRKHVGIWVRVSHEDSVKNESPEHHEYRARAYAEMKGWVVRKIYRLDAVSGKSVKKLPEAREMMEDIRKGHISGLIFSKLARLARNTKELLEFADFFNEQGADLISLQEAIDTSTPAGRLFYTMIAAMAQWEREEISARIAASVPVRAKLGKPISGQAPFGYQWVDKQLVLDPKEAPIRKEMFDLFIEHKRKGTVARLLNEAGYRTRNDSLFSYTTVRRLLTDPIAKGKQRRNYTKSRGDGKAWDYKPQSEWIWNDVPRIVTDEVWAEVNRIIVEQEAQRKRPGRPPKHIFAGLVVCTCGTKMYVHNNSPKYVCKGCYNKMPVDALEKIFLRELKGFIFSPDEVAEYLEQAEDDVQSKEALLAILEEEEQKVRSEMSKVYKLYTSGNISPEGFGKLYAPLEERSAQLEEEIPRIQGEIDFLKIERLSRDDMVVSVQSLAEQWSHMTLKEKQNIAQAMVHHIEVKEKTVVIHFAFMPNAPLEEETSGISNGSVKRHHRGRGSCLPSTGNGRETLS